MDPAARAQLHETGGHLATAGVVHADEEHLRLLLRNLALILHTSGTTGRPKGVPLTHAHLAAPALGSPPKPDPAAAERVIAPFPIATAAQRRQRFYMAQALILGGPDGQVM